MFLKFSRHTFCQCPGQSLLSYENADNPVSINAIVENVSQGLGGADAETVEHAKKYAPLAFRRQNRLVTLADFKTFINEFISSYGTVGKGTAATRRAFSSANMIDLYILERANDFQLKKATPSFKKELLSNIETQKMLTDEIVVVDGLIRSVDLIVSVKVDSRYKNVEEALKLKVRDEILTYFNVDNRDFGEAFVINDLVKVLYNIDEIRYAVVDNINQNIHVDFNEIVQLNNLSINIDLL